VTVSRPGDSAWEGQLAIDIQKANTLADASAVNQIRVGRKSGCHPCHFSLQPEFFEMAKMPSVSPSLQL
jgi:hypothetical protein